jgi:hypothetical protein
MNCRRVDHRTSSLPSRQLGWDERGSVTVLLLGLFLSLIVVAGLVFDGGAIIAGHREADAEAEGAARVAAQQMSAIALHSGTVGIDQSLAQQAVNRYLAPYGHAGIAQVNGDNVTVTVSYPVSLQILSVVGFNKQTVTGTGSATAIEGAVP